MLQFKETKKQKQGWDVNSLSASVSTAPAQLSEYFLVQYLFFLYTYVFPDIKLAQVT